MKKAFFVVGPASSGTRMVTKMIIDQGIFGDPGHEQRLDNGFKGAPDRFVFRRSIPHGDSMPNMYDIVADISGLGYALHLIIISRDWNAIAHSQVQNRYGFATTYDIAMQGVVSAYMEAFGVAALSVLEPSEEHMEYTIVNYEALILHRQYAQWLFRRLGIEQRVPVDWVRDENRKYYGGN